MSTPPILIVKRGAATKHDLDLARKVGLVVIEVNEPGDVRYMDPPLPAETRFAALAAVMVREIITKDKALYPADAKERLARVFSADVRPEEPK